MPSGSMIFFGLFVALWLACCLYALWRGGGPERAVAIALLIVFPASRLASELTASRGALKPAVLVVDLLLFITLLIIARRAHRLWPLAMTGLAMLQVFAHLLRLADPGMYRLVYWMGRTIWAYPMLTLLVIATVAHQRRRQQGLIEPSWRKSSRKTVVIQRT